MTAPVILCERCGKPMTLHEVSGKIMCRGCSYIPLDRTAFQIATIAKLTSSDPLHPDNLRGVRINRPSMVQTRAAVAYETGEAHLKKGEYQKAFEAFKRALDSQPDLIDAHLQIATLSDDLLVKARHLNTILEYIPKQEDAFRMTMVLMGEMTAEQAARTHHHNEQQIKKLDTVEAQIQALKCPICGGRMAAEERTGKLKCPFCGHEEVFKTQNVDMTGAGVSMELIKRKAEPVRWVIGKRLLHCNECGAERTIPARKLSAVCPFCGLPQVVVKDALATFQQPEGIVPFAITKEEALVKLKLALRGAMERIIGVFDQRKVDRVEMDGVYLPFWIFDAAVEVSGSRSDNGARVKYPDWHEDVPYCAVDTPTRDLTDRIGSYSLKTMVPYEPRLLADYPAELYAVDFDKASLDVRPFIAKKSKDKYDYLESKVEYDYRGNQQAVDVYLQNKGVNFLEMIFLLALLPAWVVTMYESDGDVRPALINGQTGQVTLGKTQKRSK